MSQAGAFELSDAAQSSFSFLVVKLHLAPCGSAGTYEKNVADDRRNERGIRESAGEGRKGKEDRLLGSFSFFA